MQAFGFVILSEKRFAGLVADFEQSRGAVSDSRVAIAEAKGAVAFAQERANQTADRLREALDRAEKSESFARRLTAAVVKLKMAGANLPDPARPTRIFQPPLDDETIARRRSKEQFIEHFIAEARALAPEASEADLREEAVRIYGEVIDGVPGVPS